MFIYLWFFYLIIIYHILHIIYYISYIVIPSGIPPAELQRFWSLQDAFLPSSQSFFPLSLIRPGQLVRTNGGFFTFLLLLLYILLVLLLQVGVWKPSWPQVGGPWGNLVSKLGGLGTILAPSWGLWGGVLGRLGCSRGVLEAKLAASWV